ncbi:MAG: catecholate siderophore receptor Fiu [Rhodocyclaceae bacterium]
MATIESQKHPSTKPFPNVQTAALAFAALALPGAVAAQTAASSTLPEVNVRANSEERYKIEAVSSPKFTQPLVDTPQTITVIGKEVLREQQATSLTEALRNTPGVTLLLGEGGNSNTKDNIFMRGFDTSGSIYMDGVRDLGNFARDTFNIEQIEISKGPVGADNGRGAPSGYVNLATKTPFSGDAANASLSYSDADNLRATADINRRLGDTAAWRLNLMTQDGGVAGRDTVESKRWGIAPSLAFGLGTPTRTTLSFLHIEQDNLPDGGVPTVGLPGYYNASLAGAGQRAAPVDSENFYGSSSDFEDVRLDMFTARIEHDLSADTTLRNTARYGKARHQLLLTAPGNAVTSATNPEGIDAATDPAGWTVLRGRHTKWQENELLTNQTNLTTAFNTGGLRHELSTGLEFTHERQLTRTLTGAGSMDPANLYRPNRHDPITGRDLSFTGARAEGETLTIGAYLFDTVKLGERWQFSAGLRGDRYRTEASNIVLSTATSHPELPVGTLVPQNLKSSDTLLSWKLGALYKPAPNGSVYAALSTSKQPPGGSNFTLNATATNINHPNMDPQTATNIELGTKWDVLDQRLALTAAVYRSVNKNDLVQTDAATGEITQYGRKVVRGVELGVVGAITPQWQVSAGLAHMDTEIKRGTDAQQGNAINWSPKLSFTTWTSYRLPSGLTVGGGARYVDSMLRTSGTLTDTTQMPRIDDYWVFDAMAAYAINQNLSLQLNVYNLFDKDYVASMNNNGHRYVPGTPRTAVLSANLQF